MLIGMPVAFSIGISSALWLIITNYKPVILVVQSLVMGCNSFPLLAVPLFILMGVIMGSGGISKRIIQWCESFIGNRRSGLGTVTVVACMFFAALTGSGPATVAAIGSILIPAMVKKGYNKKTATGLVAASGALGPIIPPSIPMIIYGVTMNLSIPKMFIGGIGPGILIGFLLIIINWIISFKINLKEEDKKPFSFNYFLKSTSNAFPALLLPVIVLGGIYGGIFTPTEAAAVGVTYSIIIGLFIYRELKIKDFPCILVTACETSAMVMFIIAAAKLFGWIMASTGLPITIANFVVSIVHSKIIYILLLNLLLFLVGSMMDTIAAIILLAPIMIPIGLSYGLDPLHLGVVFVINLVIGYVTPPFGYNLFTASAITNLKLEEIVKGVLPFLVLEMISVLIISFVPGIVTWLPSILFH